MNSGESIRRGWSLPVEPDVNGSLVAESCDLESSLRLLLELAPGERELEPEFGCRVQLLPRIETSAEYQVAAALIEEALEAWMPELDVRRVELLSVRIFDDAVDSDAAPGVLRLGVWRPQYEEVEISWFGPTLLRKEEAK